MKQWFATFSFLLIFNLVSSSASACSVHDQFCQFQGVGRAVNHTINQNDPTSVIIGSVGSNSVDFDNHVLLPDGNGPYITSTLGYTPRSDQPYIGTDEQPRHVYPTQYQIDFQNATAQAQYTGDVTGGAYIPNPSGCTISSATYCEEVIIRGNLPDPGTPEGFVVRQTNHLYNFPNTPNPSIDVVSYGAATGRAYFKQDSHLGYSADEVVVGGQTVRFTGIRQETLTGTGAQGAEQTYYIGYNDFDAHAAGVVVHYDQTRLVRSREYDVQFGHVTLSDGTQSHQYDAHQRQNTYAQFDRTYDFTQFVHADTGLPALHLNDQETARWDTWSDVYGHTPTAAYQTYQQEQAEIRQLAQEQFQRDLARGCLNSTCSNLPDQSVWPGVDMTMTNLDRPKNGYLRTVLYDARAWGHVGTVLIDENGAAINGLGGTSIEGYLPILPDFDPFGLGVDGVYFNELDNYLDALENDPSKIRYMDVPINTAQIHTIDQFMNDMHGSNFDYDILTRDCSEVPNLVYEAGGIEGHYYDGFSFSDLTFSEPVSFELALEGSIRKTAQGVGSFTNSAIEFVGQCFN